MATIQVEPGSKTVSARLVDGSQMSSGSNTRIYGATHILIKPSQTVRYLISGVQYTRRATGTTLSIAVPSSGTVLAYRVS